LLVQGAQAYDPTWSPDGSQLAFFRTDGIYVVNADGSGMRRLIQEGQYPDWSPDGRRIAYSLRGDIYVAAADGTGARSVSAGRR
jgi:TolB protein